MLTYLLVNLCAISIPLGYSFHRRLGFHRTWFALWPAILATAAVFIAWDVFFTHRGVWGFNPEYLTGVYLLNLPLEEWLFFICIPYACVFTYAALKEMPRGDFLEPYARPITQALAAALLLVGMANLDRLYTGVTFIAAAIFLLLHLTVFKSSYLGRFYLAYGIIFAFPFLIVNGILTGSFIPGEVVWYDNAENLGFRVFTIPVEDFIYGLLLFLMNVTIYEKLLSRRMKYRVRS